MTKAKAEPWVNDTRYTPKHVGDETGRECSGCEEHKPWEEFGKAQHGYRDPKGVKRRSQCNTCRRDMERKRKIAKNIPSTRPVDGIR